MSLFNNPSSKLSARIECWLLELQQYRFTVEYRPGAFNPADYASRHPVEDPESQSYDVESEGHISLVATAKDPMLQAVIIYLLSNLAAGTKPLLMYHYLNCHIMSK